jgi:hypothetical protein
VPLNHCPTRNSPDVGKGPEPLAPNNFGSPTDRPVLDVVSASRIRSTKFCGRSHGLFGDAGNRGIGADASRWDDVASAISVAAEHVLRDFRRYLGFTPADLLDDVLTASHYQSGGEVRVSTLGQEQVETLAAPAPGWSTSVRRREALAGGPRRSTASLAPRRAPSSNSYDVNQLGRPACALTCPTATVASRA